MYEDKVGFPERIKDWMEMQAQTFVSFGLNLLVAPHSDKEREEEACNSHSATVSNDSVRQFTVHINHMFELI